MVQLLEAARRLREQGAPLVVIAFDSDAPPDVRDAEMAQRLATARREHSQALARDRSRGNPELNTPAGAGSLEHTAVEPGAVVEKVQETGATPAYWSPPTASTSSKMAGVSIQSERSRHR